MVVFWHMEDVMSDARIGERIRELREIHNYTREAFAEKVDISAKFLYEIETGKKGFSADTLGKISIALSVSCITSCLAKNEKFIVLKKSHAY